MNEINTLDIALNHGLTEEEYKRILEYLKREPNLTEIGILGAMWSEHCSYKSSKIHLKKLPTTGDHVVQGPGENAGVVDIGDGDCVAFKMESHNHPSFIEPYQGAATGVGGILRDIFTMGARPVAILDSLRFGNIDSEKTKFLVKGVVAGIAGYGNCIGVPTVGGETYFDKCYNGNPLVNVFALGLVKKDRIFRGYATGVGNPVVYVGSKTGRDGIQGAIMASDIFTEESESKRPSVQVGDPLTEKLLLEACLELFKTDAVVGIQDMGAAGLTSSATEMADRAGTGIDIWIDKVPRREENMTPYEVMLSESQERMLMVLRKGKERIAKEIFEKWDLDFSVIGEVTDTRNLVIYDNSEKVAELPLQLINDEAPLYDRPVREPEKCESGTTIDEPADIEQVFRNLISSPALANKKWIWEQYDYMVRTNTLLPSSIDAAMIRIKGTNKGVAMTTNCNSRYCQLDPRRGAMIAVSESARNIACTGARPLAVTDCLNFGNPENPEIMWQFGEVIEGISKAAQTFNTPVVSGNVSFYNETAGSGIYPTPTIGMVGLIDDYRKRLTHWFKNEGDLIALIGDTYEDMGGSEYLKLVNGVVEGKAPFIDVLREYSLVNFLIESNDLSLLNSAHDISEGGIAVALAECCFTPGNSTGIICNVRSINSDIKKRSDYLLFSESQSRVIVSLNKSNIQSLQDIASKYALPMKLIGVVGGNNFIIEEMIDLPVSELREIWDKSFEGAILNAKT